MAKGVVDTLTYLLKLKGGKAYAAEMDKAAKKTLKAADASEKLDAKGRKWQATGAAMVAGGALLATGLAKAADASGRLAVAQGTTNAVFQDGAGIIDDFAGNSVESLGLSERAYREASSQLGAFLTNLGFDLPQAAKESNKLLIVAADLAASYGRSTGEAANAISAVLRGEYDTIERFGVALKQSDVNARVAALGLDVSTQAAKKNANAVAALQLVYEQAEQFSGRFQSAENKLFREQQQLSAEIENTKAALGEAMLPVMEQGVSVLGAMFKGVNKLDGATGGLSSSLLLGATAASTLVGSVMFLRGTILRAKNTMTGWTSVAKGSTLALAGITAALSVGIGMWSSYKQKQAEAEAAANAAASVIGDAASEQEGLMELLQQRMKDDTGFREFLHDAGLGLEQFLDLFNRTDGVQEFREEMMRLHGVKVWDARVGSGERAPLRAYDELTRGLKAYNEQVDIAQRTGPTADIRAFARGGIGVDAGRPTPQDYDWRQWSRSPDGQRAPSGAVTGGADFGGLMSAAVSDGTFRNAQLAIEDMSLAAQIASMEMAGLDQQFGIVRDSVSGYVNGLNDGLTREAAWQASLDNTAEALKATGVETGNVLNADEEYGRALIANRGQMLAAIDANIAAMEAEGATTEEIATEVGSMLDEAKAEMIEGGASDAIVEEFLGTFDGIAEGVESELRLTGYDLALDQLLRLQTEAFTLGNILGNLPIGGGPNRVEGETSGDVDIMKVSGTGHTPLSRPEETSSTIVVPISLDGVLIGEAVATASRRVGGMDFEVRRSGVG